MAHCIMELDRAFGNAADERAWHGEEARIEGLSFDSAEVVDNFHNWDLHTIPILSGVTGEIIGHEIVSETLKQSFGTTKGVYPFTQNEEILGIVHESTGIDQISYIGSLFNRGKMILSLNLKEYIEPVPGDKNYFYMNTIWGHNGARGIHWMLNTFRTVCQNTAIAAIEEAKGEKSANGKRKKNERCRYQKIVHKGNPLARMQNAAEKFKDIRHSVDNAKREMEALAESRMNAAAITHYFGSVVDFMMKMETVSELDRAIIQTEADKIEGRPLTLEEMADYTDALKKLGRKKADSEIKERRRMEAIEYMKNILEIESNKMREGTDSAWFVYNAASNYCDHAMSYRGDNEAQKRFDSNLDGRSASVKEFAYVAALDAASLSVGV